MSLFHVVHKLYIKNMILKSVNTFVMLLHSQQYFPIAIYLFPRQKFVILKIIISDQLAKTPFIQINFFPGNMQLQKPGSTIRYTQSTKFQISMHVRAGLIGVFVCCIYNLCSETYAAEIYIRLS